MATTIGVPARPACTSDAHLEYLDQLFEYYSVDVCRASAMLRVAYRLEEPQAEATVAFWRSTFGRRLARPS